MKLIYLIPLLALTACEPASKVSIIELCENTVRDYAILRDEGPAEQYADLFTEDGEFHLGSNVTKGRSALIERHKAANNTNRWRHNMTEIQIYGKADEYAGVTRFHIFAGPVTDIPSAPNREILGSYFDKFTINDGACKIAYRKVEIVFDKKI